MFRTLSAEIEGIKLNISIEYEFNGERYVVVSYAYPRGFDDIEVRYEIWSYGYRFNEDSVRIVL
jgi:hypothetical protein